MNTPIREQVSSFQMYQIDLDKQKHLKGGNTEQQVVSSADSIIIEDNIDN